MKTVLADKKHVTNLEAFVMLARWARYEYLIVKRNNTQAKIDRHERFLVTQLEVFNARHEMAKL
jgi:hypothetical protein